MELLAQCIKNSYQVGGTELGFHEYDEYTKNSGAYNDGKRLVTAYLLSDKDVQKDIFDYINQVSGESFRPQSYRHAFIEKLLECRDPESRFELQCLIASFCPVGYSAIIPDSSEEQVVMRDSEATCSAFGKAYESFVGFTDIAGKQIVDIGGGASNCTAILNSKGAIARSIDVRYINRPNLERDSYRHIMNQDLSIDETARLSESRSDFLTHNFLHPELYLPVNASNTHLASESIDIVLSNYLITGCMTKDAVLQWQSLKEALRILKAGGFMHLYPWDNKSNKAVLKLLKGNHQLVPAVYKPQGMDQEALVIAKAYQDRSDLPNIINQLSERISDKMVMERV